MSTKPFLSTRQRVMALAVIVVLLLVCGSTVITTTRYLMAVLVANSDVIGAGFILAIVAAIVVTGQMKIRQAEASTRRFRVYDGGKQ